MAYSPYESQSYASQSLSMGGLVGEAFKAQYFAWPGTWSGTKGVSSPFGIAPTRASFNKYINAISKAYKGEKSAGIKGGFKAAFRASQTNYKEYISRGSGRYGGYDKWSTSIARETKLKMLRAERQITRSAAAQSFKDEIMIGSLTKKQRVGPDKLAFSRKAFANPSNPKQVVAKEYIQQSLKMKVGNDLAETRESILKAQAGKLKWASRGKWAIRGMKAASFVGAAWLAFDIGMMIGEPIGRMLVNEANRMGERIQNRFMPEMGKLNAAYLSYGAATERQRAVQAISKSQINGRSAYGQEAMYLHS